MWISVYMSQNIENAKIMRDKIESSDIIVMFHSLKLEDGTGKECYELLVPDAELKDALDIIIAE